MIGHEHEEDRVSAIGSIPAIPDWLVSEREAHELFAATRCHMYVEQRAALATLQGYVEQGTQHREIKDAGDDERVLPLLVTGESGSGKSALVAFWSEQFRTNNPDAFVIAHYVGCTPNSTTVIGLLRRIMGEIKYRYDLQEDLPDDVATAVRTFPRWLARTQNENLILLIDGFNQLDLPSDSSDPFRWLPQDFPPYLRIILSGIVDGRLTEQLQGYDWPTFNLSPLRTQDRRQMVRMLLNQFKDDVEPQQIRQIVGDTKTANPLYLRTSLQELRHVEQKQELGKTIKHYMEAENLTELYERVLERVERTCDTSLTQSVLSLLWGSRHGLSREELRELTACSPETLDALLHALDYHLIQHKNQLRFYHDHLREAVVFRYLQSEEARKGVHQQIGTWFAGHPITRRRIEEEPWQWMKAGQKERLLNFLRSIPCFVALIQHEGVISALTLWQELTEAERKDAGDFYVQEMERIEAEKSTERVVEIELVETLSVLGAFLRKDARYDHAQKLFRKGLVVAEAADLHQQTIACLTQLGGVLADQGQYSEAEALLHRALDTITATSNKDRLTDVGKAAVLERLGVLNYSTGEFQKAWPLFEEVRDIRVRHQGKGHPATIEAEINIGAVHLAIGNIPEALRLFQKAADHSREYLGELHTVTAMSLNNLAATFRHENKYDKAIPLLHTVLGINEQILGRRHPEVAANLMNLGFFELSVGMFDESEQHYRRALEINTEVYGPEHPLIAVSLINVGGILREQQQYAEAEEVYRQAVYIRRKVFGSNHLRTHIAWLNVATILADQKKFAEAEYIYRNSLPVRAKEQGMDHSEVVRQHLKFTYVLRAMGLSEEAAEVERTIQSKEQ